MTSQEVADRQEKQTQAKIVWAVVEVFKPWGEGTILEERWQNPPYRVVASKSRYPEPPGGFGRLRLVEKPKGVGCWVNIAWIWERKTTGYKVNVGQGICSKGWGCKGNLTSKACNNLPYCSISETNCKKARCAFKIREKARWEFELHNCGRGCGYLDMDCRYCPPPVMEQKNLGNDVKSITMQGNYGFLGLGDVSWAGGTILAKDPGGSKDVWRRAEELILESCAENDEGAKTKGIPLAKLVIPQWAAGCLPNYEKAPLECRNCAKAQYTRSKDGVICMETVITLQSGDRF